MNTAVLFLVFNRLDTTMRVFDQIRLAQPPRLYIAGDGARPQVPGETDNVSRLRNTITENIDWPCQVRTFFRDSNLGCKRAVSSAIDWFFEHEEMGIILEDDCLPHSSFFPYCETMLLQYSGDTRIWHISGDNFQHGNVHGDGDYYYSLINHVWGWASWRNRWLKYSVEITDTPRDILKVIPSSYSLRKKMYWHKIFCQVSQGEINTWDYQYLYTMWKQGGLSILPNVNLISNIGFGANATHTASFDPRIAELPLEEIHLPPRRPTMAITPCSEADQRSAELFNQTNEDVSFWKVIRWWLRLYVK